MLDLGKAIWHAMDIILTEFKAPSWANDWCARCDWAQTCAHCKKSWT